VAKEEKYPNKQPARKTLKTFVFNTLTLRICCLGEFSARHYWYYYYCYCCCYILKRSCAEADSLRVSIASSEGEHNVIGVYCAEKRPPMLMSGASGSLHVILTSFSSVATATQHGFAANFSFVTGTQICCYAHKLYAPKIIKIDSFFAELFKM